METIVFDGNKLAAQIEADLKERISQLKEKPKLAIVLDPTSPEATKGHGGSNEASVKYVQMKQRVAERIGVEVQVFGKLSEVDQSKFGGVMVQLPSDEDLSKIDPDKDVDGQNPKSDFVPATVKAIEKVLDQALLETETDVDDNLKIAVVGSKGNVGAPLVNRMMMYGMNVTGFDLGDELKLEDFKVVISCTGQAGLIKPEMVKEGVIAIDVGYPKGDFEESVKQKAGFMTPVPGGVGPLTVVSLLSNLVSAYETD